MAAVTAEVAFNTARTLLNDDAGLFYTDSVLLPKLVDAFRLLEAKLRVTDASIMKDFVTINVASGTAQLPSLPSNIIEPIMLWEKVQAAADTTYIKMTEYDRLPDVAISPQLNYWQWDGTNVNFVPLGSSVNETVRMQFFGSLAEPTSGSSSLIFINAEYYLGPMTAAIMAGSIGEAEIMAACQAQADSVIDDIIKANRGTIVPKTGMRP